MGTEVLVVGAGPTGLTAACLLASAGLSVRVIDAASGPATTSRALGLQPRGVEVLQRAGALDGLPALSNPIRAVLVDVGDGHVATLRIAGTSPLVRQPGLIVSQALVEGALRRRLASLGAKVEWGRALRTLGQTADGVLVSIAGEPDGRYDWVVGSDGAHSAVRKASGIGFPGSALTERFLLADVQAALPSGRDSVRVWLSRHGILAAFPLGAADRWRLIATRPDRAGYVDAAEPGVRELLARRLQDRVGWPATLVGPASWESMFSIQRRLATAYRRGRVLLAGDAAHVHSPMGGQGMNTGLGDAENLAWKLGMVARGMADQRLLDTYEAERRPVAAEVVKSTTSLTRTMLGDTWLARVVRNRVVVPSLGLAPVQRLVAEQSSQLRVSYRHGPLARGPRQVRTARPRRGDRVPDFAARRLDGRQTSLYAELAPRWVLVLPAERPSGQHPCASVADRWLGPGEHTTLVRPDAPEVLLVRPDGHLGWRGSCGTELSTWFAEVLTATPTAADVAADNTPPTMAETP